MNFPGRLAGVRRAMEADGLDALLVSNLVNVRYLCGFAGSNGYLFITPGSARFITDGRYRFQAADEVHEAEVQICMTHQEVIDTFNALTAENRLRRIGYEATHVTVASRGAAWEPPPGLDKLGAYFGDAELVAVQGLVEELRKVKEAGEIEAIRRAAAIGDKGFEYIVGKVKPGVTERELALDLEFYMRSIGAEAMSFDVIVAAGERSALPHARPTEHKVERGRFVLFDFGCVVDGYCSDMTRTVIVGPADDRHRDVYEMVLQSQSAGLEAVGPGIACGDVDAVARNVIAQAGHEEAFMHGLGHGVGLEIHEAPSLKKGFPELLQPGHVVTVEPGAYFEDWGGVRVEDLVAVTEDGIDTLSRAPRDLIVL
ncbi:MAG: Xaa-Pro peptidase family protein [Actinomycetota bacterium]